MSLISRKANIFLRRLNKEISSNFFKNVKNTVNENKDGKYIITIITNINNMYFTIPTEYPFKPPDIYLDIFDNKTRKQIDKFLNNSFNIDIRQNIEKNLTDKVSIKKYVYYQPEVQKNSKINYLREYTNFISNWSPALTIEKVIEKIKELDEKNGYKLIEYNGLFRYELNNAQKKRIFGK